MLSDVRHIAKLWHSVYGVPWDILLLQLHIRLVGHMVRSISSYVAASAGLREILTDAVRNGRRRARRGPDWSGVGRLSAFLQERGDQLTDAHDRNKWQSWEPAWIASFGLATSSSCVVRAHPLRCMWDVRCLQGSARGSQTLFWAEDAVLELQTQQGWVKIGLDREADVMSYLRASFQLCRPNTVHLRVFTQFDVDSHVVETEVFSRALVLEWSNNSNPVYELPFHCDAWRSGADTAVERG